MKIGDRVKFVNDTGVGIITKIKDDIAYVDVTDGFEIPVAVHELVVVSTEDELKALSMIGVDDDKPGRKKHKQNTEKKDKQVKKEPAYKKYGRVALINDFEEEDDDDFNDDEDEDFVFDVYDMKDKYLKTLAQRREKENEMEQQLENIKKQRREEDEAKKREEEIQAKSKEEAEKEKLRNAFKPKAEDTPKHKVEKKKSDIEVVDLHAEEVLGSVEDMSSGEIITAQLARYTFTLDSLLKNKKHGKIVFIHGVGKGRLKYEMLKVLKQDYKTMHYQDASFKEYGYGAIIIYY